MACASRTHPPIYLPTYLPTYLLTYLPAQVPEDHIISVHDVSNIFRVPLLLKEQELDTLVLDRLRIQRDARYVCM